MTEDSIHGYLSTHQLRSLTNGFTPSASSPRSSQSFYGSFLSPPNAAFGWVTRPQTESVMRALEWTIWGTILLIPVVIAKPKLQQTSR